MNPDYLVLGHSLIEELKNFKGWVTDATGIKEEDLIPGMIGRIQGIPVIENSPFLISDKTTIEKMDELLEILNKRKNQ